jgi:hypothetical protein
MGPHQGQAEQLNLLEELLEAFVSGDPCLYLRNQILGDVDRVRAIPGALVGNMLAGVEGATVVTTATGPAAAMAVGVQRSGQDGASRPRRLRRLSSMRRIQVGWSGTRMAKPETTRAI